MAETIDRLTAIIDADISGLKNGIKQAKGLLGGFAVLGAASLGFGAAVGAASQFDKNLRNIQATARLSNAEMVKINQELLDIGKNSTFGSQKAAEAFYDIVGGVQDSSKWMAILEQSISTAQAGQADLMETTRGLVFITNAYNMKAKDMIGVSDVLTRTVGVGVGSMNEFVNAMSPIAVTAKTLGIQFKDLGKMTGFISTKGNTASESATQLQSVMQALLKPNTKMTKQLKKLGFASGSAAVKQLGFIGTLQALKKSVGGSTDALAQMFGRVEGFKGVLALTGKDFAGFSKDFEGGLKGATAAAEKIQLQGFDAQFKLMQSMLESVAIKIGQVLLPPLMKLIEGFTNLIDIAADLHPAIIPIVAAILGIGAAAGPAIGLIKGVGGAFSLLFGALKPIILPLIVIGGLFHAYQTNWMGFRDTVNKIGDALRAMPVPLAAVVVGLAFLSPILLKMALTAGIHALPGVFSGLAGAFGKLALAALPLLGPLAVIAGIIAAYATNTGGARDRINELSNTFFKLADALKLTNERSNLPGNKTLLEKMFPGFKNIFVKDEENTPAGPEMPKRSKSGGSAGFGGAMSAARGGMTKAFASGGYTGSQSGVAGLVHGREFVVPERGALVMKSGGGNSGPSIVRVQLYTDRLIDEIDVNLAAAMAGG